MFRLQAAAKGIDFVFRRPAVLPVVIYADEERLRQILINLLSNAIKFTQVGSVQFVVHYRSPVTEFEVTDTGPGIQADDLERIFAHLRTRCARRFATADRDRPGLTISRLLAGVMGGDVEVTSTVGTGSTFRVKILLSEVTHPTRIAPIEAPIYGYRGPRRTILITDHDPTHRVTPARSVRAASASSCSARPTALPASQVAQHCRPDCSCLDISMAGMDGMDGGGNAGLSGHHQARS